MPRRNPREWKPNRRQRRVLTVLMTGAPSLSGYPVMRLAQTGAGTVYILLARLERLGWVSSEWEVLPFGEDRPRRRFYALTPEGRERVTELLGLEVPDVAGR